MPLNHVIASNGGKNHWIAAGLPDPDSLPESQLNNSGKDRKDSGFDKSHRKIFWIASGQVGKDASVRWTQTNVNGVVELAIEGDIDLHVSPRLRSELQKHAKARCPALLIDFNRVGYIDSSGLATFVEYFQSSQAYQGKIAFYGLNPRVRSVFDLVRLSEVFPILSSRDEAIASLKT